MAESGLEVASLGLTPAGAAFVTLLVELAELVMTVVAGYENDPEAFVHGSLTFDGNTITATNTSDNKIADDNVVPLERIGIHCEQSLPVPTIDLGVWAHIGIKWIAAWTPSHDFHLLELIEDKLGIFLDYDSFGSSMSNTIGGSGTETNWEPPDSIQVNFIV